MSATRPDDLLPDLPPGSRVRFLTLLLRGPLFALVPLVLVSLVLILTLRDAQQEESRKALQQTTRTLAVAVQQALEGSMGRLQALSRDPTLAGGQLTSIHERLVLELSANPQWRNLTLTEPTGVQLVSADVALGTPLPTVDRLHHRQALSTGQPVVSDIYENRRSGELSIAVSVPVPDSYGQPRNVLTARLAPAALAGLLASQTLREGGLASILDRDLRFVARSRNSDEIFGQQATPGFKQNVARGGMGLAEGETRDGDRLLYAWERLPSGWTVAVGIQSARLAQPLQQAVLVLGVVGLLTTLLLMLHGWRTAQRLAGELDGAGTDARDLAEGQSVPRRESEVLEFDTLFAAQHQAGSRLAALLEAERGARQEAERLNRQKDEFLAMLGHELRNPLGAVLNGVRALGHPRLDPAEHARLQQLAQRQAMQLKRLVDDLLDVSRAVAGKIVIDRAPVQLDELARRTVEALQAAGTLSRHTVQLELSPVQVAGDALRLEQVLGNLLTNAAKFTPAGGAITVRLHAAHDRAVLSVRDTGRGIPPELLPRVFELFVQGEQALARGEGGLGIGLTLARRLVDLHGGSLAADSGGADQGATFTVRLPLLAPLAPPDVAAQPVPAATGG